MESLGSLYISNNNLKSLPQGLAELKHLRYLYAWNNSLASLVDTNQLRVAILYHNNLTRLPSFVSAWSNLHDIQLDGNPVCPHYQFPSNLKQFPQICQKLCSDSCPNYWRGNKACDSASYALKSSERSKIEEGCNVASCNYDDGDCI